MKRKKISYYLENLNRLNKISIAELEAWVNEYPYIQNLRFLLAKKHQIEDQTQHLDVFHKASTYSVDRPFLYQRMTASEYDLAQNSNIGSIGLSAEDISEPEKEDIEIIEENLESNNDHALQSITESEEHVSKPLKTVEQIETVVLEVIDDDIEMPELEVLHSDPTTISQDEEILIEEASEHFPVIDPSPKEHDDKIKKKKKSKKKTKKKKKKKKNKGALAIEEELTEYSPYTQWLMSLEADASPKEEKAKKKKKKKNKLKKKVIESVEIKDEIVSETLAELLAEQGHISKSKKMFKKLKQLQPQKREYYEAKIQALKK